ncbi:GNAT family N-acetyltransferase [Streptomyces lycii]|uniref:GNAT family N-acetyltransferase n=1 Tax=Streptomyces lycii TaxID=2654337 RepID=A0ABQ7FRQ6_9ACTN|nr:GNAT family N-acetyltransferase [Streptomyces lycii]KAF4410676.1 GNAT family N-acetyltransferase [Streptomyces lycii]
MAWTTTEHLGTFLGTAGAFLRALPARHSVLLSVADSLERGGSRRYGDDPPEYGWWTAPDGEVAGAFLRTPPHPVLLSTMPDEAAVALAARTEIAGAPADGVNAVRSAAEAYAAAWQRRTGGRLGTAAVHRLHRLAELVPPDPAPPGRARVAGRRDRALLVDWYASFMRETGSLALDPGKAVDDRLGHGGLSLWEDASGPLAMAGVTPAVAGTARIASVYTPPELRGRGYAGAVTAEVSRVACDAGLEVLLFTDLANPTSNALYRRLGYRPVEDHLVLSATG